jgi:hypothetical protein
MQNAKNCFKPLKGSFFDNVLSKEVNGEKVNYMYIFSNKSIELKYILPQIDSISDSCDYFLLFNKKFSPSAYIHDLPACELDINSFKLFKGEFNKRSYILLTAINNGSGKSTTLVFCLLFDITNHQEVKFFPLWSKYGGTSCFGDFNNDGKLDFLKAKEENNQLKIILMTLDGEEFRKYDDKHYIIAKKSKSGVRIIKKNWW